MSQPLFRKSALAAALVSLGLAVGASAQTQQPSGGTTATPAPPAAGSTGMDKGAGAKASTTPSSSASKATSTVSAAERKFIEEMAQDHRAEVELSKLALEKASDPKVKDFAKKMVDDHGKALEDVKKLAAAKGVTLPADLERGTKRLMDKLSKKSGHDFDKEYIDEMEDDHQKDLRKVKAMAKSAKDADVKAFANSLLPTLEQHLQVAKSTEADVKAAGRRAPTTTASPKATTGAGPTGTAPSTAAPGKDTAATTGTAGPGTGMPASTKQQSTSAPQPPGGPADTKTTTPPK